VRHVSAGGSMLVEDTLGKGHISRHPKEGQRLILSRCQKVSTAHPLQL
jgi:hypothetical protein